MWPVISQSKICNLQSAPKFRTQSKPALPPAVFLRLKHNVPMPELHFLSAATMAEQVRQKKISPVELADAHFARIAKLNPKLNAFVALDEERARRDAGMLEGEAVRGDLRGPLHGVPISIKSSIDTAGLRCESGTRLRAGNIAVNDAVLVSRLAQRGSHNSGRDQHAGAPDGMGDRQSSLWPHQQPVGSGANTGRIERRRSGGHRIGMFGGGSGQRRRGIDPGARTLQWNLRTEADSRDEFRRPVTFRSRRVHSH